MQIDRLRLVGFKSFVDATELTVSPGLTGIVGPNGCGKSNLVEALRWVMGETSAKRLRGGEMDDVIFAGSADRPARNLAEVALTLDNSARDAPFAFNDREEIEIVRRIERAGGSVYRVNGHEVRARDVQLLFADAASGAHSGAMVSQGRVSALIEAKPAERRGRGCSRAAAVGPCPHRTRAGIAAHARRPGRSRAALLRALRRPETRGRPCCRGGGKPRPAGRRAPGNRSCRSRGRAGASDGGRRREGGVGPPRRGR